MLRTAYGVIIYAFASTAAYGQCIQADSPDPVEVSGTLQFQIFAGPPGFKDVKKGDKALPTYTLQLHSPLCLSGDELVGKTFSADRIHIIPEDEAVERRLGEFNGQEVRLTVVRAFGMHTGFHKAPIIAYTQSVSSNESDEGMTTVEAFYLALAAGSGTEAAKFIIPEKRMKGPFSAQVMTRFYGNLYEPLSLISVKPLQSNQFMVHYRFRQSPNNTCNGRAIVTVEMRNEGHLIQSIRSVNGC
ncbi:hypothetical protein [Castellaniella sp.]|uniref:hypothetical protein n=1 Tax=Castellaniella sp. TaxID=1955812 RepID=UPI002AFF206A|nr:hypothetical protein [Castellaniella sp.]